MIIFSGLAKIKVVVYQAQLDYFHEYVINEAKIQYFYSLKKSESKFQKGFQKKYLISFIHLIRSAEHIDYEQENLSHTGV